MLSIIIEQSLHKNDMGPPSLRSLTVFPLASHLSTSVSSWFILRFRPCIYLHDPLHRFPQRTHECEWLRRSADLDKLAEETGYNPMFEDLVECSTPTMAYDPSEPLSECFCGDPHRAGAGITTARRSSFESSSGWPNSPSRSMCCKWCVRFVRVVHRMLDRA